jgi:hypothetical protein
MLFDISFSLFGITLLYILPPVKSTFKAPLCFYCSSLDLHYLISSVKIGNYSSLQAISTTKESRFECSKDAKIDCVENLHNVFESETKSGRVIGTPQKVLNIVSALSLLWRCTARSAEYAKRECMVFTQCVAH